MTTDVEEGTTAPDFNLPADGGGHIRLSNLRGRKVVLYFYPKDDTSGCTREAADFTALADAFAAARTVVVGVSPDSPKSHDKFKKKHDLSVRLVSDQAKETLAAYEVWTEKTMYGRKYMGVERSTFLIDGTGMVRKVWRKVKVPGHAKEVLAAAEAL